MSGNGNQVPMAPNQRGPGSYPRASTPHRPECYHTAGATGSAYMPSTAGGAQASAQAALRIQPTPQPSAPPAPQQDMSKTTMAGHNYVSPSTQQGRPQYNFQYRAAQHGARPNTHPRPQQPFIPGAAATASAPVMYHPQTFVLSPAHMGPNVYQQSRSNTPGFYQFVAPYISYGTPHAASHTSPYYYASNSQQLPTPNLQANASSVRNNPSLMGSQGTTATPTAPTVTLPQSQAPTHMHQAIQGIRPAQQKRPSHRVPIIDPVTQQDIFSELYSNEQYLCGDPSEREDPQPEPPTHSIAEEFTRMVNEVANQPTTCESALNSNFNSNNMDLPISTTTSSIQPQTNAIISNSIPNTDMINVNESKLIQTKMYLGPDVALTPNETPVVSAISDSPVIVPKMPVNIKHFQKNSEQDVQSLVLDKSISPIKPHKQIKSKPVVPQVELETTSDAIMSTALGDPASVTLAMTSQVTTAPAVALGLSLSFTPTSATTAPAVTHPQPQRIREPRERVRSQEKGKSKDRDLQLEKEYSVLANKPNGPTSPVVIASVDNLPEIINLSTNLNISSEAINKAIQINKSSPTTEIENLNLISNIDRNMEIASFESTLTAALSAPTATQLLSASIEKLAKEMPIVPEIVPEDKEESSAINAQAKLTQSLCLHSNQPETKTIDINLNNKTADSEAANGNTAEIATIETPTDNDNSQKVEMNSTNNNHSIENMMAHIETNVEEATTFENSKDETDKISNISHDDLLTNVETVPKLTEPSEKLEETSATHVFVPKYNYIPGQWSPLNKSGRKCYDIGLLKQMKDNPLSKNKPSAPLLEICNVIRTAPMQESLAFSTIARPMNDSLFPQFAKSSGLGSRGNPSRDPKKDGRNMLISGKSSTKSPSTPSSSSQHKPVIHVSLSRGEEIKLNETKDPWKPRMKADNVNEEEFRTQDLYKKFRGILNKLTPQKFDTLLERVKTLEINNQKRLEGVIDLVFEKAIEEPNFSEAYAAMCNKLSMLKVPADNASSPDQCVNFRALIISKCQNQFVTDKVDEQVLKLERDLADSSDPGKKRELHLQLQEENRRLRMRSVGNVRFIGELYKLKMLTSKIMVYCMNYLIDKLEEEKLECLCKLLTTIGEQVESEVKEPLDSVFKKMQDMVERKSHKISSRVRFMIQDVIELRRRRWVIKSVVDSQPKMMDQIQKEAEQQQRHIELMNASPMSGFRRDDGGRGKRGGDGRRQNANSFIDSNSWKASPRPNYTVDTSKLKAVTQKNLSNIKLAPQNSGWNHGSGTKNNPQPGSNSMISLTKTNMYSVLENVQTDPTSLRGSKEMTPSYHAKGASIERSTFNSRGDFNSGSGGRSGSVGVTRSKSGSRGTSSMPPSPVVAPDAPALSLVPQEPLPASSKKSVKAMIDLCLLNPNDEEMVAEVKLFPHQYHADVVNEIINVALEKTSRDVAMIAKSLAHLVSTNTIASDNFVAGIKEVMELAPDLHIDIPKLYEYLGKFIAPQLEKKHITFAQIFRLCENIISSNQGHLFLKAIIRDLKDSMGPSFTKCKWQESELQLTEWMNHDQVAKWIEDNKFEFLEGATETSEEREKILTPAEAQIKLLQLMNFDENCECLRGWIQDNLGKSSNEDWFMRALIQAIFENALFGVEGRDVPHFNQERMNRYSRLINEFGETQKSREASCLVGIQQLIHKLEHPQGLTLEIFQYLHEQYIISPEGFMAWEESELEPEGKGVMMKALTSFFTNIKEAENEDSCSED